MGDSRSSSRPYQLGTAVICTILASSGFIAAGYADNSSSDAAITLSGLNVSRISSTHDQAIAIGFDPATVQGAGVKLSFAKLFVQSRLPAVQQLFDLTDPNDGTPPIARGVSAMQGNVPELSMDMISKVRRDIVTAAYVGLGHRYVWGGTSFEYGWDCSGFVQWAYAHAGIALPRTEQWAGMVKTDSPQPGDIVVQNPDGPNHWSHIGIYVGNGKMISALNPSVGTLIHAPGDVSSSSTYFTVPAFVAADEQARANAAAKKADTTASNTTGETTATTSAAAKPAPTTSATTPATTSARTNPPATPTPKPTGSTTPATTAPTTKAPATRAPTTTTPGTKAPTTTTPATKAPTTTTPATKAPTTTTPATAPAKNSPGTTAPATTAPETTATGTTAPASTAPATTAPAESQKASETTAISDPPASSGTATESPSALDTATGTSAADPTTAPTETTGSHTATVPSP